MASARDDCLFCKIAAGEFNTEFVAESDHAVAFNDISPLAHDHVLIVPRAHVSDIADTIEPAVLTDLFALANQVARNRGLDKSGYRLVTNLGSDAGQTVFHLHIHLLGGEPLGGFGARKGNSA